MRLLIFAGAGTSVELGVPAMVGMAGEFLTHCQQSNVEPDLVEKLMSDELDIEYLIESLDKIYGASQPLQAIADVASSVDSVGIIRSEVEWFVQHAAERVTAVDANFMWGSVLATSENHELTFVTTNYDRGIELAANAIGVSLLDSFEQFGRKEIAKWVGFFSSNEHPLLIKLHGSTDWYSDLASKEPLKLRHPMPLFGQRTLKLSGGEELGSALILPSREKLLTKPPYPRLSQAFLNAGDNCEAAIFIGSSLRDIHILDAAKNIAMTRPVFIIDPNENLLQIDNVQYIAEPASRFLMSTLPSALAQPDPLEILKSCANVNGNNNNSILELVRLASNMQENTKRRCKAIDRLDQLSVKLGRLHIDKLLNDADSTVSRYSLGLVSTSPDRDALITSAQNSPHIADPAFAEELRLLNKLT